MARSMDFWFEFASTYSYPAAMRVEQAALERGVSVNWKAFLLGPVFSGFGMDDSPFNLNPVKGRYMWRDMERICMARGLSFRKPSVFPRGSLIAARIVIAGQGQSWIGEFIRQVYTANFAEDRAVDTQEVIASVLDGLDLDSSLWLERAQDPSVKAGLKTNTEEAVRLGIFGAPTILVGDEMFWGDDRLDQALASAGR